MDAMLKYLKIEARNDDVQFVWNDDESVLLAPAGIRLTIEKVCIHDLSVLIMNSNHSMIY